MPTVDGNYLHGDRQLNFGNGKIKKNIFFNSILIITCFIQDAANLDLTVVVSILGLQMSTGTVLLYCYVGSLTTSQFLRFGDISYESDWIKMPIAMRRFILLLIADAQRPIIFKGLSLIDLNLMTFTTVIIPYHTSYTVNYSYFSLIASSVFRS